MPKKNTLNLNARMIHKYGDHLRHALGRSDSTISQIMSVIMDYLDFHGGKDLKGFKPKWAIDYKDDLASRLSQSGDGKLSLSTINSRLRHLSAFHAWLADQEGYRSRIRISDASYFSMTANDARAARSKPRRKTPSVELIIEILKALNADTPMQKRDRALIAFILLTGARADAAASFPLGNIDVLARTAFFDGRTVRTKFRKGYTADFFPVGKEIETIVTEWVEYLRRELFFGNDDPLFPATNVVNGDKLVYRADGLSREFWKSSTPVRSIFRLACELTNATYFNPHSLRSTLTLLGQKVCKTPEEFKAWSQSLGHDSVDTTFRHYGRLSDERQAELMARMRGR